MDTGSTWTLNSVNPHPIQSCKSLGWVPYDGVHSGALQQDACQPFTSLINLPLVFAGLQALPWTVSRSLPLDPAHFPCFADDFRCLPSSCPITEILVQRKNRSGWAKNYGNCRSVYGILDRLMRLCSTKVKLITRCQTVPNQGDQWHIKREQMHGMHISLNSSKHWDWHHFLYWRRGDLAQKSSTANHFLFIAFSDWLNRQIMEWWNASIGSVFTVWKRQYNKKHCIAMQC